MSEKERQADMSIFVIVPGGWGGKWQWREVIQALWKAGHEVCALSLTGLGERAHLANPEVNLSTHIQDVVAEITCSDLKDVILVGHSYAGMVITAVAHRIPERISKLVYLDAAVPADGQSYADLLGPEATEMLLESVKTYGEGWKLYPDDPDPRFTPQPIQTGLEKAHLQNLSAAQLSRIFICCTEKKPEEELFLQPMRRAAEMARDNPHWRYLEIPAPHNPLVDHRDKVAKVLLELAQPEASASISE
jgi:pimeloyl-ACP methyl ester carboxylesterase